MCTLDCTFCDYPPQAREKLDAGRDAGSDAGQTLDEPLGESEACQSRGAPASLKREDLAFLEQGWQSPLTSQTPSQ